MTYQFLHAPPSDPRNVAGDSWSQQLSIHVLHAISRSIPFVHLAQHLKCDTMEIVETCKRLEKRGTVGIRDGKRVVLKGVVVQHLSDRKLSKIYDLVTKDIPCHHIRIDDIGYIHRPWSTNYDEKSLAVRFLNEPLIKNDYWSANWFNQSRWKALKSETASVQMSAEELTQLTIKALMVVLEPYAKRDIDSAASPLVI